MEAGGLPVVGEAAAPARERVEGLAVACTRRGILVLDVIVMEDVEVEIEEKAAAEEGRGETRWSKVVVRVSGNGCDGGDEEDGGNLVFMGWSF